jgi:hypothetical protein
MTDDLPSKSRESSNKQVELLDARAKDLCDNKLRFPVEPISKHMDSARPDKVQHQSAQVSPMCSFRGFFGRFFIVPVRGATLDFIKLSETQRL